MVKNFLWPFLVMAGLSLANPSKAALGWTWDECRQHWGEPLSSKQLPNGQFTASFEAHGLAIIVWLTDDEVAQVAYSAQDHQFSTSEIETLQKANTISPTATWVFSSKDESTQNYVWELREDPDNTGWIATGIYVAKDNAFVVFTSADDQRAEVARNREASDL